ncbi:MAG TPA: bifunctional DNA primase/polymerase, partial [Candidatus Margulisiibacteriota bacterium]|nr:bifunctional DNA primase/polymerase [Candidatus Margulisiibacteriota bacterium]
MIDEDSYGSLAPTLCERGWFPIPAAGKEPCIRWEEYERRQPSALEVLGWARQFPTANIALVLGPAAGVVALDFDADDGAEAMRLGDIADEIFEPSPIVRVGRYPRHVRLYQAKRIPSQQFGSVEALAGGRLVTAYGIHPDTNEPYHYCGSASLIDIRPTDLPRLTGKQVEEFRCEVLGQSARQVQARADDRPRGSTGMTLDEAMRGVRVGSRHRAMFTIASALRGAGSSEAEAVQAVIERSGARRRFRPKRRWRLWSGAIRGFRQGAGKQQTHAV